MLLKEIKNIFHQELNGLYPTEEVNSFFHMLIEHHLGLDRFVLALQPNLTITKQEEQPLFEALSELRSERPIQYIIGEAQFMEMDFKVDGNVLIPRPETEELVRWILEDIQSLAEGTENGLKILDIGTGSGCIAVSLAKNTPGAEVYALDVSENALNVALGNAELNKVSITYVHADILELQSLPSGQEGSEMTFDIIVSNPPYVRELEKKDMHQNVKGHEPGLALFVSDGNPLKFYNSIAHFSKKNLNEKGSLYLEINQYLSNETEQLLRSHHFTNLELRQDMFGNPRMVKCSKTYHKEQKKRS